MPFKKKAQVFNAAIKTLTIGSGEKAITLGGQNVNNLYAFDAEIVNAPKVGVEISDLGLEGATAGIVDFYAGCETVADMAKKASEMEGADFICIKFDGADPNGQDKSVEECVEIAKAVAEATDMPLAFMGCKNAEKDSELFNKISEALQGKNILVLSAKEENYKGVGAAAGLAYGQKVGAESAVDINLAKQLNVLLTQLGVSGDNIAMNVGTAAAGYGFEYVVSTLERVKGAALTQNDAMLQMPIVTPVSTETWGVKESILAEADAPEWGSQEERIIEMEVCTASACLVGGSDMVIMKHPAAIATIAKFIDSLM